MPTSQAIDGWRSAAEFLSDHTTNGSNVLDMQVPHVRGLTLYLLDVQLKPCQHYPDRDKGHS